MPDKILAPFLESDEVLFGIRLVKCLAWRNVRSTTVHLQGPSGSNNNGRVWLEATDPTLDIAEFLHTHVGTKATLGEDVANAISRISCFGTGEFQSNSVSKDGRVSVRDIGKWAGMDKDGSALSYSGQSLLNSSVESYLKSLHQIRLDSILQKDSKSTRNTYIVGSDSITALARGYDHGTKALLHIL